MEDGVYLYSVCVKCRLTFNELQKQLIFNMNILGEVSPKVEEYRKTHSHGVRRLDLEWCCNGLTED